MPRPTLLPAVLLLAFTTLAMGAPATAPATTAGRRPLNVLLIISDDLRAELSSYGGRAKTPNLDALAAAGVRFDRAYCQYPLCNPSRVSMLTGRQPVTTGVFGNRTDFRAQHPDWVTLPQLFKENGYVSVRAGKIFHGAGLDDPKAWSDDAGRKNPAPDDEEAQAPPSPANRAPTSARADRTAPSPAAAPTTARSQMTRAQYSDRWIVLEGDGEAHGDYRTADRTIENLRAHRDRPFFIACGFVKPHSPPTAPQRFYDQYPLEQIALPPDFAPRPTVWEGFPKMSVRPRNADLFIGREATPQAAKEMIRAYLASTSWMDFNVGRVLAELDRLGLRDDTVVIFWGDHGYQLGEKGKWSKAGSVWEQGSRVPLIVAAPKAKGNGQASPRVVESIDILPTLADLCGLPAPRGIEGRSLAPLLNDPQAPSTRPAFTVWSEDGRTLTHVAVRTERYRYAEFDAGRGGAMLLEPQTDPHELKNLADDPAHRAAREELAGLVKDHVKRAQAARD